MLATTRSFFTTRPVLHAAGKWFPFCRCRDLTSWEYGQTAPPAGCLGITEVWADNNLLSLDELSAPKYAVSGHTLKGSCKN